MVKYMISWDDDTIFIEAPRSPEIMELVKKVLEVGMNPVGTRKVKPNREKIVKRLQEKQLMNHISKVFDPEKSEDEIVADFYAEFPDIEVNDHRLRRTIRQIIKKG